MYEDYCKDEMSLPSCHYACRPPREMNSLAVENAGKLRTTHSAGIAGGMTI